MNLPLRSSALDRCLCQSLRQRAEGRQDQRHSKICVCVCTTSLLCRAAFIFLEVRKIMEERVVGTQTRDYFAKRLESASVERANVCCCFESKRFAVTKHFCSGTCDATVCLHSVDSLQCFLAILLYTYESCQVCSRFHPNISIKSDCYRLYYL